MVDTKEKNSEKEDDRPVLYKAGDIVPRATLYDDHYFTGVCTSDQIDLSEVQIGFLIFTNINGIYMHRK